MKVPFFQYQNGINNGDVINACGLFLIINFCNFVLRLLLPHDTHQVLKRHIKLQSGAKKLQSEAAFSNYKVGQNNCKMGQLKNYKVGEKIYKVGQVLQSGAKKSQSGAVITKWGITHVINLYLDIFTFIIGIQPGSEYSSDERNKLSSFSKEVTLKATILGIRMCSTELLL